MGIVEIQQSVVDCPSPLIYSYTAKGIAFTQDHRIHCALDQVALTVLGHLLDIAAEADLEQQKGYIWHSTQPGVWRLRKLLPLFVELFSHDDSG